MTIEKKPEAVDNIVIDLDGPNGNAFYLLGVANNLCKQVGLDFAPIEKKMKKHISNDFFFNFRTQPPR